MESEGWLQLLFTSTDDEQNPYECLKALRGYKNLQSLRESGAALSLQYDTHPSAGTTPLYGDGLESLSSFHRLWYLLVGRWGAGAFACKRQDKNCGSERKRERAKETGWAVGGIIPVLTDSETLPRKPVFAYRCPEHRSTMDYSVQMLTFYYLYTVLQIRNRAG